MTDWKRKLAAYLHDPPSKALDIATHGERSDAAFRRAGFIDTEVGDYFKLADHTGAAADRLPFPASQVSGLRCAFDGRRNCFLHPLRGDDKLPFYAEFKSAEQGIEGEESVQPLLAAESLDALSDDTLRCPPSARLDLAMRVFFSPGALGFRVSRAAGAFCTREHALTADSWKLLVQELERGGFKAALLPDEFANWVGLCDRAGSYLKNHLRSKDGLGISAGKSGTAPNALGSADPRQSSVVQFRPVRVDGKLRLALLEAPHARTLGPEARRAHGARGSILKGAGLV